MPVPNSIKELNEMLKDVKDPKNANNELLAKDPMFWVNRT